MEVFCEASGVDFELFGVVEGVVAVHDLIHLLEEDDVGLVDVGAAFL